MTNRTISVMCFSHTSRKGCVLEGEEEKEGGREARRRGGKGEREGEKEEKSKGGRERGRRKNMNQLELTSKTMI